MSQCGRVPTKSYCARICACVNTIRLYNNTSPEIIERMQERHAKRTSPDTPTDSLLLPVLTTFQENHTANPSSGINNTPHQHDHLHIANQNRPPRHPKSRNHKDVRSRSLLGPKLNGQNRRTRKNRLGHPLDRIIKQCHHLPAKHQQHPNTPQPPNNS